MAQALSPPQTVHPRSVPLRLLTRVLAAEELGWSAYHCCLWGHGGTGGREHCQGGHTLVAVARGPAGEQAGMGPPASQALPLPKPHSPLVFQRLLQPRQSFPTGTGRDLARLLGIKLEDLIHRRADS